MCHTQTSFQDFFVTLCSLSSQQTPMHTAAKVGNEYTMRELVKLGANMNIKDNDGVSETVLDILV